MSSQRKHSRQSDRRGGRYATSQAYLFRREGEYWTVVFDGKLCRLRDSKGLHYLAHLLRHPDEPVPCADLGALRVCTGTTAQCNERMRLAVTKRIRATLAKITALHPELASHLKHRIKTGRFCVYVCDPRGPISWTF